MANYFLFCLYTFLFSSFGWKDYVINFIVKCGKFIYLWSLVFWSIINLITDFGDEIMPKIIHGWRYR